MPQEEVALVNGLLVANYQEEAVRRERAAAASEEGADESSCTYGDSVPI